MRTRFRILLAFLLALLLGGCSQAAQFSGTAVPRRYIPTFEYVDLAPTCLADSTGQTRTYTLDNGDTVCFGSLAAAQTVAARIPYTGGTLHLYAPERGWSILNDPSAGDYSGTLFTLDTETGSVFGYIPQSWTLMANNARKFVDYGFLRITDSELQLIAPAAGTSDYTLVTSTQPLIDWTHPYSQQLWSGYANCGSGRWCFDGYYWPAPSTYVPTGEGVYYRMVDAYLCRSFLGAAAVHRAAEDLSICTLDVMADQQNAQGFFPTQSGSTWLSSDYQIGPGFYDTRFNTDLVEMFRVAWERYHIARFEAVLYDYLAFYQNYANTHRRMTENGGWLIDDYCHPVGNRRTHTSLNHQLAEALLLYKLSDTLGDPSLAALADRMVLAIEDTASSWIRSDRNLHYGCYPDGSYGGTDYPYLTYNDLFDMQKELQRRGGRSAALDRLMAAKKAWMDATGVTGYRT